MTRTPIDLDGRRGIAAQKATEIRRQVADVAAGRASLRARQESLELQMLAGPAATWNEAAEKATYLIHLFAASAEAQDPRRQKLVANVLADFDRLAGHTSG